MGKKITSIILATLMTILYCIPASAGTTGYQMKATAYCINGTTATGTQTRVGVAASKREWFGKTVRVYADDGTGKSAELIGTYVIEDTGGKPIRSGKVIDIWMPTYDECIQFGRRSVIVFVDD